MQIEKINNDKIQVIINTSDLEKNNIDVNTFMSNSIDHQELFLDILDIAEKKLDFYVSNSKLAIESISIANNTFVFTITKLSSHYKSHSGNNIYCFDTFDDVFNIIAYINVNNLFCFNNKFYLTVNSNSSYIYIIEEFASKKITFPFFEDILLEHSNKA